MDKEQDSRMNKDILLEHINQQQWAKIIEEDQAAADCAAQITSPPLQSPLQVVNI